MEEVGVGIFRDGLIPGVGINQPVSMDNKADVRTLPAPDPIILARLIWSGEAAPMNTTKLCELSTADSNSIKTRGQEDFPLLLELEGVAEEAAGVTEGEEGDPAEPLENIVRLVQIVNSSAHRFSRCREVDAASPSFLFFPARPECS